MSANNVSLSEGQILFLDATNWTADDFPNLPPTVLGVGVRNDDTSNISTILFTNTLQYAPKEPKGSKPLIMSTEGVIEYTDMSVGYVSTFSAAFTEPILSFQSTSVGGPNIQDVSTESPDTITNALAKLDAWIGNAFLLQPPAVKPVECESTVFYGGLRWLNCNRYNILDTSVPHITSVLFTIGCPKTPNYCVLELLDVSYFPLKTFRDGISPYGHPLVRLRVFTDGFPAQVDKAFSKGQLLKPISPVRIVSERGTAVFPECCRVLAFEHTDGIGTYTTMSVYLPSLKQTYPRGTRIPISVVYLNNTDAVPTAVNAMVLHNDTGSPSPPFPKLEAITQSTIEWVVRAPAFSDTHARVTMPLFDRYDIEYTPVGMNTRGEGVGFRYGLPSPTDLPAYISTSTITQSIHYIQSTQTVVLTGVPNALFPGVQWSTSITAYNSAGFASSPVASPIISTQFPVTSTLTISSTNIVNTDSGTRTSKSGYLRIPTYNTYCKWWDVGSNVSTDVFFLSSPTTMTFSLESPVQFNDSTYPGDRSTITVYTFHQDVGKEVMITDELDLDVLNDDFPVLNTNGTLSVALTDSQVSTPYSKFFYNASISGAQTIKTVSLEPQNIRLGLENQRFLRPDEIPPYVVRRIGKKFKPFFPHVNKIYKYNDNTNKVVSDGPPPDTVIQLRSSITYSFQTEPLAPTETLGIYYNGVTNVRPVSGLYTPSVDSEFLFDIECQNIGYNYIGNSFATAQLVGENGVGGPSVAYISTVTIYNGQDIVSSTPFPLDTPLLISSCRVGISPDLYQQQGYFDLYSIYAYATPANPYQGTSIAFPLCKTYMDVLSCQTVGSFNSAAGTYGLRLLSDLPIRSYRRDPFDMGDGAFDAYHGLDVSTHTHIRIRGDNSVFIDPASVYNHERSLQACFTDPYSRELLYSGGQYTHASGYNFDVFNGNMLGVPVTTVVTDDTTCVDMSCVDMSCVDMSCVDMSGVYVIGTYPNFTNDLVQDINGGYRYATFAFESPANARGRDLEYLKVRIVNPGRFGPMASENNNTNYFPSAPLGNVANTVVRLHVKLVSAYKQETWETGESSWINGFKVIDYSQFDESVFDIGGCVAVEKAGPDIVYTVQYNKRKYTKLCAIVRIGISVNAALNHSEGCLSFDSIRATFE